LSRRCRETLGGPAPVVDGQIAAIAHVNDLVLVTLNARVFGRFKEITVVCPTRLHRRNCTVRV
jgi:predicted nucleic acid-binding protein